MVHPLKTKLVNHLKDFSFSNSTVRSVKSVIIDDLSKKVINFQLNKFVMSDQLLMRADRTDCFDHAVSVDVENLLTQNLVPQI